MQRMRPATTSAPERLRAWKHQAGLGTGELAKRCGVSRQMISSVLNGQRLPGRRLANTIARLTAVWEQGPIATTEWDLLEAPASPAPASQPLAIASMREPLC